MRSGQARVARHQEDHEVLKRIKEMENLFVVGPHCSGKTTFLQNQRLQNPRTDVIVTLQHDQWPPGSNTTKDLDNAITMMEEGVPVIHQVNPELVKQTLCFLNEYLQSPEIVALVLEFHTWDLGPDYRITDVQSSQNQVIVHCLVTPRRLIIEDYMFLGQKYHQFITDVIMCGRHLNKEIWISAVYERVIPINWRLNMKHINMDPYRHLPMNGRHVVPKLRK